MRKNLAKILGTLGLISLGFSSLQAQDSIKIGVTEDSIPCVKHISYIGDSIIKEKIYVLSGENYKLSHEKTTNFNKEGKLLFQREIKWSYDESLKNIYQAPKNLQERREVDKYKESVSEKLYTYENGKLKKINKSIRKGDDFSKSHEYFMYIGREEQQIKWKDDNGNEIFDEGDKMKVYNSEKEMWIDMKPYEK